ncbi:hypothetical protein C0585_00525 [Candidatus Woesearchaeota archaeon]|nr:MAG: hypothetical protein C0585_00525 [Candidatus Woesearchaeota archaeon]
MNKKGNMSNQIKIIIGLLIFLLTILLFFVFFKGLIFDSDSYSYDDEFDDIRREVDSIKGEFGAENIVDLSLFSQGLICFADLTKKDIILAGYEIDAYPIIKNSLANNLEYNFFVFDKDHTLKKSYNLENMCIEEFPHFFCFENENNENLELKFKGIGTCADLSMDWESLELDPNNRRKNFMYDEGGILFLIDSDENVKDKILLLNTALWRDNNEINYQPYVVINKNNFNDIALSDLIDDKDRDVNYYFDYSGSNSDIESIDRDNYTASWWDNFGTVVLLNEKESGSWLIGSLFASYINAPIFFIDGSDSSIKNVDPTTLPYYGKNAYLIDENTFNGDILDFLLKDVVLDNNLKYYRSAALKASLRSQNPYKGIIGDINLY